MSLLAEQMSERRQRILAAARETIAAVGVEGLTMRRVAEGARVTVPTVYNLVGSRDEVLATAIADQTERWVERVETFTRDAAPASRALAVVEACVEELLRVPDYYPALLRFLNASPAASEGRRNVDRAMRSQFEAAVDALSRAGQLADWVDPKLAAARLRAQLSSVCFEWAKGELDAEGLRRTAMFDLGVSLRGLCRGSACDEFERIARESQARDGSPRPRRSRAAGGRP